MQKWRIKLSLFIKKNKTFFYHITITAFFTISTNSKYQAMGFKRQLFIFILLSVDKCEIVKKRLKVYKLELKLSRNFIQSQKLQEHFFKIN